MLNSAMKEHISGHAFKIITLDLNSLCVEKQQNEIFFAYNCMIVYYPTYDLHPEDNGKRCYRQHYNEDAHETL